MLAPAAHILKLEHFTSREFQRKYFLWHQQISYINTFIFTQLRACPLHHPSDTLLFNRCWFHSHINYFSLNTRHASKVWFKNSVKLEHSIIFWNSRLRKTNCLKNKFVFKFKWSEYPGKNGRYNMNRYKVSMSKSTGE